jgi:hypothetical protein
MIPMSFFLLAWFVLVFIFVIFAILSLAVHMKFGLSTAFTTVSAGIFLGVSILVMAAAGVYILRVDWSRNLGAGQLSPFGTERSVSEFEL